MFKLIHDVNPYVEQDPRYQCDNVKLEIVELKETVGEGEGATEVTTGYAVVANPADVYGEVLAGTNPLVYRELLGSTFEDAIKLYEKIERELSQGDVIRNI